MSLEPREDNPVELSEQHEPLSFSPVVPAIELIDVHKDFAGFMAVNGLTLSVPQASFFGFLGPNGAGKTTTIRMLTGLARQTSGTIRVLGMDVPGEAEDVRRQVGIVPDDTLLFDHLTGSEFVEFVARMYGLERRRARERARELLTLFELEPADRKLIGEYSKGMRKRVAMCGALIHRPKLFLMDEPFEGVDVVGARLMKDILSDQVRRGATVFLTSHVLEVVERLCDRVAIINKGQIAAQGTMAELRAQAQAGATTLEDIFVNLVGAEKSGHARLDWL
jgi:ABC-2 type transport system ATP-binding protein